MDKSVATGRRKTAVASVRVRQGKGNVTINGRPMAQYLPLKVQQDTILAPFESLGGINDYDLVIRVKGGGIEGQVGAIRLGVARALASEVETLQPEFKDKGYLTRDPRKKERKKYGRAGARKRFQFSKR